jgi:23S rRNA (adenine2030-N6)-methyltransferase
LQLELRVRPMVPGSLAACGLLVVNPPWKFEESMREALPWVADQLGPGARVTLAPSDPSLSSPTA